MSCDLSVSLLVTLDRGESISLSKAQMQHLDYAYALRHMPKSSPGLIIITGDVEALAKQQMQLSSLSPKNVDVAMYVSDGHALARLPPLSWKCAEPAELCS